MSTCNVGKGLFCHKPDINLFRVETPWVTGTYFWGRCICDQVLLHFCSQHPQHTWISKINKLQKKCWKHITYVHITSAIDCLVSSAPFTHIQTYLLTYLLSHGLPACGSQKATVQQLTTQYNQKRTCNGMARHYSQQTLTSNTHTVLNTTWHSGVCRVGIRRREHPQLERHNCRHQQSFSSTQSVSLHTLTRHPVDDAITVRIHEPDGVRREPQTKTESETRPEENVEYRGIIFGILCSQIQRILRQQQQNIFSSRG